MWLGQKDPMLSMEEARALDPVRGALAERVQALQKCFGEDKVFTANDVHKYATELSGDGYRPTVKYPDLLNAFSRDGRNVSAWQPIDEGPWTRVRGLFDCASP